ncbi:MAG: MEDS domain-containing protein [Methylococcales bacterium]
MQQKDQFLTIAEAAQLLKVSKTSLRRWSNDGRLRCYRVGHRGERRFRHDELLSFVYGAEESRDELSSPAKERVGDPFSTRLEIRPPCHVCTMFKDDDDQWRQIRSYLLAHLVPGTRTVYVYHGERRRLLDRLREEGIDGQHLMEQGTLQMLSCFDTYLLGGFFDGARILDLCAETIKRNSAAGTGKLLVTGEMAWCASEPPGCEQLIEYESAYDELLRDYPRVTVVCQYSLATIAARIIYDNLCLHRYVQLPDRLAGGLNFRAEV